MKVIAGLAKGRKLKSLKGLRVRPTPAMVREAIFNIIGDAICDSTFLDLFAGTGGVGVEALSRGAKLVIFVEKDGRACSVILENLKLCGFGSDYEVVCKEVGPALSYLAGRAISFDAVFLDPPYDSDDAHLTMARTELAALLKPDSAVMVQHSVRRRPEKGYGDFTLVSARKFGDTELSIYKKADQGR